MPSIDVIIPTLGRPEHLRNVLADLAAQTLPPSGVFVIEQDPRPEGVSALADLGLAVFPFALRHHYVRWVGACRARNLALDEATAEWVLFLDDDVRFPPGLLQHLLATGATYNVDATNGRVHRGEEGPPQTNWSAVRVWDGFNTCCGMVRRTAAVAAGGFDESIEGGFGEDNEFGVRLRHQGTNVVWSPGVPVKHLNVTRGGFRRPFPHPWQKEITRPRPSPTLLYSRQRHFSADMAFGYHLYYLLSRLRGVTWRRLGTEIGTARRQWHATAHWADMLVRHSASFPHEGQHEVEASPRPHTDTVDVIIPTLGRPEHVANLLADLAAQTRLPQTAIVVEQVPADQPRIAADMLAVGRWPFTVRHERVEWAGACRARNLALRQASADWVLFLDDDVRLPPGLIDALVRFANLYGIDAANARVRTVAKNRAVVVDSNETEMPDLATVWPFFASGASLVRRSLAMVAGGFDESLEGGFGEDVEFGVRLRLTGGNVVSAPHVSLLHLKAPAGGFRFTYPHPWLGATVQPRPSPTVMRARRTQYTRDQERGYRLAYLLERLAQVPPWRGPATFVPIQQQWQESERWAMRLGERHQTKHLPAPNGKARRLS